MERIEAHACFGGRQEVWQHHSSALNCDMKFGIYLPPAALQGQRCPSLYWLSGLTCTEQNFITKAGAQQFAAQHNIVLIAPDTSPRGESVTNDPGYDLGQGASFYLNATQAPWNAHFQMEQYIVQELVQLVEAHFPASPNRSIAGHSMGGHGALTLALRNPQHYRSISAFSPIVAPSQVPWGQKAFAAYLGENQQAWLAHDAVALLANATEKLPLRVDQGLADEFLDNQLKPTLLQAACDQAHYPLELYLREGYDHSYYFIASYIGEHIAFHAKHLER